MSVIVRGLDAWGAGGMPVSEPRLLTQVQHALPVAGITSLLAAERPAPPTTRSPTSVLGFAADTLLLLSSS